jgi:hypothetical protein
MLNMSWTWAKAHNPQPRNQSRRIAEAYKILGNHVKPGETCTSSQIRHWLDMSSSVATDVIRSLINRHMLSHVAYTKDVYRMLEDPANLPLEAAFKSRCVAQKKSPVDIFKSLGIDPRTGIDWMQGRATLRTDQEASVSRWARS